MKLLAACGHPLVLRGNPRPARTPGPRPRWRRLRSHLLPGVRRGGVRPRSRSRPSRCGARRRATRATATTESSTGTSAGTSTTSTCARASRRRRAAATPGSSTTGSPARRTHKEPYDPDAAREKAADHAGNFMFNRRAAGGALARPTWTGRPSWSRPTTPSSSATGGSRGPSGWISWCARSPTTRRPYALTTPSEYLERFPREPGWRSRPMSSWGDKGYSEVWLDGSQRLDLPPPAHGARSAWWRWRSGYPRPTPLPGGPSTRPPGSSCWRKAATGPSS